MKVNIHVGNRGDGVTLDASRFVFGEGDNGDAEIIWDRILAMYAPGIPGPSVSLFVETKQDADELLDFAATRLHGERIRSALSTLGCVPYHDDVVHIPNVTCGIRISWPNPDYDKIKADEKTREWANVQLKAAIRDFRRQYWMRDADVDPEMYQVCEALKHVSVARGLGLW